MTPDHYTNGRLAAESGKPADAHGLIVGTVQHRDWKRVGTKTTSTINPCPRPRELEMRAANTQKEARENHMAMCRAWASKDESDSPVVIGGGE